MSSLPQTIPHVGVPPIKCQGIKTKLVPFLASQIVWAGQGKWIEPFLGSGVVAFNLRPQRAILADTNQYIIHFYQRIQQGQITGNLVRQHLQTEGARLLQDGEQHYYRVRSRFNAAPVEEITALLDFLFLNRACFNGLMRFNRQGGFNVPFCRKPQRFAPAYITKIANQVDWVAQQIGPASHWSFRVQPWDVTLAQAMPEDFVYLDPPYIGRHADYYNGWTDADAGALSQQVRSLSCGYGLSMWLSNRHRTNPHIQVCWPEHDTRIFQHFYHVGAQESLRGRVAEGLLLKPGCGVAPVG